MWLLFSEIYIHKAWHSPNTLPTMICCQCQAFCIYDLTSPQARGLQRLFNKTNCVWICVCFFLILRNSFLQIKFTFFFCFFTALYLFSDRFIIHLYYIGSIIIQSYPPLFISEKLKENDLIIQSSH